MYYLSHSINMHVTARLFIDYEASASDLLENLEEIFLRCY